MILLEVRGSRARSSELPPGGGGIVALTAHGVAEAELALFAAPADVLLLVDVTETELDRIVRASSGRPIVVATGCEAQPWLDLRVAWGEVHLVVTAPYSTTELRRAVELVAEAIGTAADAVSSPDGPSAWRAADRLRPRLRL